MKRVLIISLSYFPLVGGDGVAIREITKRIDPTDIEFQMVTFRFDSAHLRHEKIGNIEVHRIGWAKHAPTAGELRGVFYKLLKWGWFQFYAGWYAWRLHRKTKFDAVWVMMAHSAGVPGAIFKLLAPSVPLILTLQEGDPPEAIERTMRPFWPFFKRAFTHADIVQTISVFLGEWARHLGYHGALEVIPNGVDVAHFSRAYSEEELSELKKKLGKKEGDIFLITTSRLVYKNALDTVVRALALLPPHVHFLLLGIGAEEEKLRAIAQELNVNDRIHFLGLVSHEDMPKYLKVSDIFVRPSRSEGFGNSFIEAMAAGLPVIATQEGGIADFLFDAKKNPDKAPTGWAVDKDSPKQIADATQEIIGNPEATQAVIENARRMVVERYDWELVARAMHTRVFNRAFKTE